MFNAETDLEVGLTKIKHQVVFELMCLRKERLRALVERVNWRRYRGMPKHVVLSNGINELKELSPKDTKILDNVEKQVHWVLDTYYGWIS